jgi:hypothetical protein
MILKESLSSEIK